MFGTYGLFKKLAPLRAVQGLTFETGILVVPAAIFLIVEEIGDLRAFAHSVAFLDLLMVGAGPLMTLPLLMFAADVRNIPLSLVGMLQYINPTIHITLGVMLYDETFTRVKFVGFGLVWSALVLFAMEGY